MNLSRRFAKFMLFFGTVGFLLPSLALSAPPESSPPVEDQFEWIVSDDPVSKLQLQVKEMPLERILSTITAKTGVPIHYSIVPEGLVTATCVGPTLKHVMECLLARKADLIVRYQKPSDQSQAGAIAQNQVAEMWVLGSRFVSEANCSTPVLSPQVINNVPFLVTHGQDDEAEEDQDQTEELIKQSKSNDVDVRAEAIGALRAGGREGDANVRKVLEEALSDQDARVRAQAISSLAQREGADAAAALQDALHDRDAGVRLMAVDGAGDNVALLQQAINDEDEVVRQLARSKLEELMKETGKQ
jgi:hypothetical protein